MEERKEVKKEEASVNGTISPTAYDDVFRDLTVNHKKLLLPLINVMFPHLGNPYKGDEEVINLNDTYIENVAGGDQSKRIADCVVKVIGHDGSVRTFHIECQSTSGDMHIRMFEYDSQIGLKMLSKMEDGVLHVQFPISGVLYLESTQNTPDTTLIQVEFPDSDIKELEIPNLKLKDFNLDKMFQQELFFLVPFYLFNLRNIIDRAEKGDREYSEVIRRDIERLATMLRECVESKNIQKNTYDALIQLANKVNEKLLEKKPNVKKEVDEVMSSQIINYPSKEIFKEGFNEGIAEGLSKGVVEGLEKATFESVRDRDFSPERGAQKLGITLEDFITRMENAGYSLPVVTV